MVKQTTTSTTTTATTINEGTTADRSSEPKYKGVRKRKWGKWVSEIRLPNSRERIWLGSYDSAEKAARAFDAAMFCLRGGSAKFNFPDNPPNIAGGRSLSRSEIQAAAANFANSTNNNNVVHSSDHSAVSELQMESPCPSVGSDLMMDIPFLDLLNCTGSGMGSTSTGTSHQTSECGIFPGFDDLQNNLFGTLLDPTLDFIGDETFDGAIAQDPSLWNF